MDSQNAGVNASKRVPCRHCQKPRVPHRRGLCYTCYLVPSVRHKYRSQTKMGKKAETFDTAEGESVSLPFLPTDFLPGSREKVEVMCERVRLRMSPFHKLDAIHDEPSVRIEARERLVNQRFRSNRCCIRAIITGCCDCAAIVAAKAAKTPRKPSANKPRRKRAIPRGVLPFDEVEPTGHLLPLVDAGVKTGIPGLPALISETLFFLQDLAGIQHGDSHVHTERNAMMLPDLLSRSA